MKEDNVIRPRKFSGENVAAGDPTAIYFEMDKRAVMAFYGNGTVEFSSDLTPAEAAKEAWVVLMAIADHHNIDVRAAIADRDRLVAEVARLREEVRSLLDSRRHHRDSAINAKARVDRLRKRKAALMAALLQVCSSDDLSTAKFVARIAHDGWEDDEMIFNNRAALTSAHAARREGE